ncbi:MAG: S9 family peptidase [Brumimicrobium sp.]|nr:S9 family peptidase [Brumimicrobium sp.]
MKQNRLFILLFILMTAYSFGQKTAFSPSDLWKLDRIGGGSVSPDNSTLLYSVTKYDVGENKGSSSYFTYNLKNGKNETLSGEVSKLKGIQWTKDRIAGIQVVDKEKKIISTTLDNDKPLVIISLPAEQLIDFKISPEGKYLVTIEKVKTRKTTTDIYPNYPKSDVRIIDDLMYRHWDTWQDEFSEQLFVYTLENGVAKTPGINLLDGTEYDVFGGMSNVIFLNENSIVYACKKKIGKEAAQSTDTDLYIYDIASKSTENWTEHYMGYDQQPIFHEKTQQLAWLSMANDGFESDKSEIIIRDITTQTDVNLTHNIDLTISDFVWNEKGDKIYFLAVKEATFQYFEIDVKTKNFRQITEGVHDYTSIQLVGTKLIGMRQSMLTPNEFYEADIKTGVEKQLTHINDEFLAKFDTPKVTQRWVTTSDGEKMLVWVILPPNFDENRKYPTLLYCQGGPQSAVSQFFSFRWNFRLMASQGYVVVAPNRRGLPGFGSKWNNSISKDWGGQPMRDYLAAIDDVSKEKYVDKERRGAVGASYGGYSIYFLAGNHEGRFKTFIAHDGLFNMTSWYGTTEELFFANWDLGGPYWEKENEKSYTEFNPTTYVNNWDTPILIIQGGNDFRVPIGQGLEAFQVAQLKGIKSKLLYFPEENHWVMQPQNAMIWQTEFYKWLLETLN